MSSRLDEGWLIWLTFAGKADGAPGFAREILIPGQKRQSAATISAESGYLIVNSGKQPGYRHRTMAASGGC
jgi:hypothetical protein